MTVGRTGFPGGAQQAESAGSTSSITRYHSQRSPSGSSAQTLFWRAWQQLMSSSIRWGSPPARMRSVARRTSRSSKTSTPRWFRRLRRLGRLEQDQLQRGSLMEKFAYPGFRFRGSTPNIVV